MGRLKIVSVVTAALAGWATTACAGVVIGANSVSASAGAPATYPPPVALVNIINQSGLSARYVSGVTDFSSFTATTTATYRCIGDGCYPELGAVASDTNGDLGSITFAFNTPVTLDSIVVWNPAGPVSLKSFSLDGIAGVFDMPASSQNPPQQPAEVFAFAPTTVTSLTMNILSNYGYAEGTVLNEVAFEGAPDPIEKTVFAKLFLGGSRAVNEFAPGGGARFAVAPAGEGAAFAYNDPDAGLFTADLYANAMTLVAGQGVWKESFLVKTPGFFDALAGQCPPGHTAAHLICHVSANGEFLWVWGVNAPYAPPVFVYGDGAPVVSTVAQSFSASVPEPRIWMLMTAGVGAIGAVMRRRPKLAIRPG